MAAAGDGVVVNSDPSAFFKLTHQPSQTPPAGHPLVLSDRNVPNEAKRLLKTKDHAFASPPKAKRSLKIKHLSLQSQEVIEK